VAGFSDEATQKHTYAHTQMMSARDSLLKYKYVRLKCSYM